MEFVIFEALAQKADVARWASLKHLFSGSRQTQLVRS
jgi:hypothetical protein